MNELEVLEKEVASLRALLQEKEAHLHALRRKCMPTQMSCDAERQNAAYEPQYTVLEPVCERDSTAMAPPPTHVGDRLPKWAIERYSRQILLSEVGVEGQERLCKARVLIVGAGGLGCPAAAYIAGAGVGVIGIVDYDCVDVTNLHRQILHSEQQQGLSKVDSVVQAIRRLNSHVNVNAYNLQLTSANALEVISGYDVVLDCTDNVPTRYLLNDACVLLKVPLVSGSALKLEGQLTIYGYRPPKDAPAQQGDKELQTGAGPCYRCLFPTPPPPETVGSCSAQGVLGPVAGAVGALQALEAVKLLVRRPQRELCVARMLLLDGEDSTCRSVKLRSQNPECSACSADATITQLMDYEAFCRAKAKEKDLDLEILAPESRISPRDLAEKLSSLTLGKQDGRQRHLLVDVRSEPEFNMCRIDGAVNYPIDSLAKEATFEKLLGDIQNNGEVTFLCRRGNDSQLAAQKVLDALGGRGGGRGAGPADGGVRDLAGGLHAWARDVDADFPVY